MTETDVGGLCETVLDSVGIDTFTEKTLIWIGHGLSLSSPPALPHHSSGAGDWTLSCPHTDSCSDALFLSCARAWTPLLLIVGTVLSGSDWTTLFVSEPALFMNTGLFFSAHRTDSLADCEEIFPELDKKCTFEQSFSRITDSSYLNTSLNVLCLVVLLH